MCNVTLLFYLQFTSNLFYLPSSLCRILFNQNTSRGQGWASLELASGDRWISAEDNTGQYVHKGHIPSPKVGINIPDPAGNITSASGLKGRVSADLATAMDY